MSDATTVTQFTEVIQALKDQGYKPVKRGKGYKAHCPAHDDKNPSLDIDPGADGKALLTCQSQGCAFAAIMVALNLQRADGAAAAWRILRAYSYTDARGRELYQVVRWLDRHGKKQFRARREKPGGGWINSGVFNDVDRVLYRLPEVIAAVESEQSIWITEGEKDSDCLAELGLAATTSQGGAGKFHLTTGTEVLRGAVYYIIPDADGPGRKHARQVAEALVSIAASVKVINLDDVPLGGDVSDWLDAGHTVAELEDLAIGTPVAQPAEPKPDPALRFFDGAKFVAQRLAAHLVGDKERFLVARDEGSYRVHEYQAGAWREKFDIPELTARILGERSSAFRAREVSFLARFIPDSLTWDQWNAGTVSGRTSAQMINCLSGMLDVEGGTPELLPHDRSYYSTLQVPVEWNPKAKSARLDKFLEETFGDPDTAEMFCMAVGLFCTGYQRYRVFVVLEGPSNTGKSTAIDAVIGLLGTDLTAEVTLQDLVDNRFAGAGIQGKTLTYFDDLDPRTVGGGGKLKAMTGGLGTWRYERKGQDGYRGPLTSHPLYATNDMPLIRDDSGVVYNRMRLFPCSKLKVHDRPKPDELKIDTTLPAYLAAAEARQALFTRAVNAWARLCKLTVFPESATMIQAKREYMCKVDPVVAYTDAQFVLVPDGIVTKEDWWSGFTAFLEDGAYKQPPSKQVAYRRLLGKYNREVKLYRLPGKGTRAFKGIQRVKQTDFDGA